MLVKIKIYNNRDDFDFEIVNVPFPDGDVSRSISYGVYISQLIRFAEAFVHVDNCNNLILMLCIVAAEYIIIVLTIHFLVLREQLAHSEIV